MKHYLVGITVLIPSLLYTIGVEEIHDTYTILQKPYQHLSIIHGGIWWENGLIRNYHDFGKYEQPDKHQWLGHGYGPIQLIHALFTKINNSFVLSTNASYPATHIYPSTIAKIIAHLEKIRIQALAPSYTKLEKEIVDEAAFKQSTKRTEEERKKIDAHYKNEIKQKECELKSSLTNQQALYQQLQKLKEERTKAISKVDTQRLFRALKLETEKEILEHKLSKLEKLIGKEKTRVQKEIYRIQTRLATIAITKTDGDCNRVRELAAAILNTNNHSVLYPPYSAYAILLAFLYKKAQTKQDLLTYYRTLHSELGSELFTKPHIIDNPEWLASRFTKEKLQKIQERLATIYCKDQDRFLSSLSKQQYEKLIYAQIIHRYYHGAFPKKAEYAQVKFNDHIYPDCTETTLRNLCNIQLYDPHTGTFDLNKAPTKNVATILRTFYEHETHKQVTTIEYADVHQQWADMLVNRPWITYRSMMYCSHEGTSIVITEPEGTDGFIRGIPTTMSQLCEREQNKIKIANHWYVLIEDPDIHLFEMIPTIRNLIIVLNQLFGLQLYTDDKELLNNHFNSIYFQHLCKQLAPLRKLKLSSYNYNNLDEHDYCDEGIHLSGKHCELELLKNHAEYTAYQTKRNFLDCAPALFRQLAPAGTLVNNDQLMNLLPLFACEPEFIPQALSYLLMFAFDLQNHEEKLKVLRHYLQPANLVYHNHETKERIVSATAKLIAALPIRFDWLYQIRFVDATEPELYSHPALNKVMQQWKQVGYQRLYDETAEPDVVPYYFATLVHRGQSYEDGITIARLCRQTIAPTIQNPESKMLMHEGTLNLYLALAQKNQVQREALTYSQKFPDRPISKKIQAIVMSNLSCDL